MRKFALRTLVIILAGFFGACKDDPVTPPPQQVRGDTVKRHFTLWYDSTQVFLAREIKFAYTAKLPPWPQYTIRWMFDTAVVNVKNWDSTAYTFTTPGPHQVKAMYIDSTGTVRDSASATLILPNPADTSSHDFVWKELRLPTTYVTEDNATGCLVFGPNDIYVCNWYLYHYDGSTWSRAYLNNQAPGAISGSKLYGFAPNDFWIISGSIMYHWNGTSVEHTRLESTGVWTYPHDGAIHSAWGTSSRNMYFVGDSGTILHFDGSNWTNFPKVTGKDISSISGSSNNSIWAAGYNGETGESELLHFDGGAWSKDSLSLVGLTERWGLNAVYAFDSSGHSTVATAGWTMFRKTDNNPWRSDSGKIPNDIGGRLLMSRISGNSVNDFFVTGDCGLVTHWNGRSWKRYDQFLNLGGARWASQASIRGNTVCLAGFDNRTSWVLIGQRK